MNAMDPHEVLGVAADTDLRAAKKAYVRLVKIHKPERDPERFAQIRAAYEALRAEIEFSAQFDSASSSPPKPDVSSVTHAPNSLLDDSDAELEPGVAMAEALEDAFQGNWDADDELSHPREDGFVLECQRAIDRALLERRPGLALEVLRKHGWHDDPMRQSALDYEAWRCALVIPARTAG